MKIRIIATNALMSEDEFRLLHKSDSIAFPLDAGMQSYYGVQYEVPLPLPDSHLYTWVTNPDGTYATTPKSAATIAAERAEAQVDAWERIKVKRDRLKTTGGALSSGKWFHTDTYSRTQWLGMVILGANLPVIPWRTMDGTTINTTPALASAVFQAVLNGDVAIFAAANAHKAAMEVYADPSTYDCTTGWPTTYV